MSRIKAPFKLYEGSKSKDKHIRKTSSMMLNQNYLSLKPSSIIIYDYMKLWACGNEEFDFSISMGKKTPIKSTTTINNAIDELVKKGFIDIVKASTGGGHIPRRFRFSSRWLN